MSASEFSCWVKLANDSKPIRLKLAISLGEELIIMDLIYKIKNEYPQLEKISLADISVFKNSSYEGLVEFDVDKKLSEIEGSGTDAKNPMIIKYKITETLPVGRYHFGDWDLSIEPVRILGDNQSGPHSTAIIIGPKAILACAHSLALISDSSKRISRSNPKMLYLEDYWIQPRVTKLVNGECNNDSRIPIRLYKFHIENDWALFERADGSVFLPQEIANIDTTLTDRNQTIVYKSAIVLHCPVALFNSIRSAEEFNMGCHKTAVTIQGQSSHHIKYENRDLTRGSSGGGIFIYPSRSLWGMHIEAIHEMDYDMEVQAKETIEDSGKRVKSEDYPYEKIETVNVNKKKKSDSETVASLAGGNNGLGSALIICNFPRLMHYINLLNK